MSTRRLSYGTLESLTDLKASKPPQVNGVGATTLTNGTNPPTIENLSIIGSGSQELCLSDIGNEFNPYTFEILKASANYILEKTKYRPKIAVICGSGLGGLANTLEDPIQFPYSQIPHFPVSTVPGHDGKLVIGLVHGKAVLCMKGRFHFYEGYPLWKCSMPVRVFKLMGIQTLIVTNAAGGLNPDYKVGDVMLLKDHVNLPGFSGDSPLRGPNDDRFGDRFIPMNNAYDSGLRKIAKNVADRLKMDYFREGVYTMVGGPAYETVAELRLIKMLGIDAVGMSTVPEVMMARHCGIRCLGFSLITNKCITDYDTDEMANHEEVIETANQRQEDLKNFVQELIREIN